jgi:hypothetical protein
MNERTFLKKAAEDDTTRTRLKAEVSATLADFARSEGIRIDQMSDEEIRDLATGFVRRGFGES